MTTSPDPTTLNVTIEEAQHQPASTLTCNTATGATVAQLPEPVPELEHTNRSQHVHYEPGQHNMTTCAVFALLDRSDVVRYVTPEAWPLSLGEICGAGGNRTPVHQPVNEPATTIPVLEADAASPAGRLTADGGQRPVFPGCQPSFRPSVVFPTVIPRFCCRAAVDRPRAAFLLTMSLRSPEDQAARANCSSAILFGAPFYESEQLGSHARPSSLTSKPVSPVVREHPKPTAAGVVPS